MSLTPSAVDPLAIPGFTFADLHEPARLADLYRVFAEDVQATEPALWDRWTAHAAGAALGPIRYSNLLVALAPHVSRFVTRLFAVGPDSEALAAATRAYDDLFRFKIDFVRRRALPLLKGGAPVQASPDDHAYVEALTGGAADLAARELLVARAGCQLLDREEAARASGDEVAKAAAAVEIESLRRWCAAHVHAPALKDWVVFRFPETLDYEHLVPVTRRDPALPQALSGPEETLRRRDGFELTDTRYSTRELLSEVHYCMICHERDKDSCWKGLTDKEGAADDQSARHRARRAARSTRSISEMHLLSERGDPIGALALVTIDNPMCPGTGHRICNDCMKGCIFQKQEPVNIPQVETSVAHRRARPAVRLRDLQPAHALESAQRRRARTRCPTTARTCWSSASGPAGYTLAHYLLERRLRRRRHRRPEDRAAADRRWPATADGPAAADQATGTTSTEPLDERILLGLRRRLRVRHHRALGQELPDADLPDADAAQAASGSYGGVRFGGTLTIEDALELGFDHVAIATGAGRPTIVDHEEQPASAASARPATS